MQRRWLVLALFLLLGLGRQSPAQQAPANNPGAGDVVTPPASEVALDAAVITIDGLCRKDSGSDARPVAPSQTDGAGQSNIVPGSPDPSVFGLPTATTGTDDNCRTVITRAQFEKLINALSPQMSHDLKMQVATFYPQMLLSAQRIKELGLEKDPSFETKLGFGYVQVLHKAFTQYVQDKARDISDADVEKYYKEHPEAFEQVDLLRILVPTPKGRTSKPTSAVRSTKGSTADASTMKLEAQRIRRQAVAGGNFETLQDQAFKAAGDSSAPPNAEPGKLTRAEIPAAFHKAIFELRPGQVSEPLPGPEGLFIFKVRAKSVIPLSDAKGVIQKIRTKEAMDGLKNSIHPQLNDAYFKSPAADTPNSGEGASR